MSTKPVKKEKSTIDFPMRSEEELLEEEIKNQQTIDIYFDTEKNWC